MKRFSIFILLLFFTVIVNAQFTDRYWTFGDSAAIDFRNLNAPIPAQSILRVRGTCVSICDSVGDLLFYGGSPDLDIWHPAGPPYTYDLGFLINKNHQKMNNGDSLKAALWYQEMIIVPDPGNINRFYLFTAGVTSLSGFFYNQIDLTYNGGLGKVIQKNVQLQSLKVSDAIAAVKHGNGRDWWVVMKSYSNTVALDEFYVYLVSPSGVSGPFLQHLGTPVSHGSSLNLKFTKDGKRLFSTSPTNLIESYDFDRCTGVLSNVNTIANYSVSAPWKNYWSFALSPDASKLYTTSVYQGSNQDTSYLVQYDLNSTNILASADTLYTFVDPVIAGLLQVGPDDKIYLSVPYWAPDCDYDYLYCDTTRNYVTDNISVINSPDSLGAACNFQPFSFNLGGHRTYVGLPNNPNYELKADSGSVCDTLHVGVEEFTRSKSNLFVFYDSQWKKAFINANKLKGKNYMLEVFDVTGRKIINETGVLNSEFYTRDLDMNEYSAGMYIISLSTEKEKLVRKFLKN